MRKQGSKTKVLRVVLVGISFKSEKMMNKWKNTEKLCIANIEWGFLKIKALKVPR